MIRKRATADREQTRSTVLKSGNPEPENLGQGKSKISLAAPCARARALRATAQIQRPAARKCIASLTVAATTDSPSDAPAVTSQKSPGFTGDPVGILTVT